MKLWLILTWAVVSAFFVSAAPSPDHSGTNTLQWIQFPDARLEVCGLPWFKENAPQLWRLPGSSKDKIPQRVWERAVAPDGGRIRFASETSRVVIRFEKKGSGTKRCFFDVYVDNKYVGSQQAKDTGPGELLLCQTANTARKEITIYLPNNHEVRLLAIGVDEGAKVERAKPFALNRPIVCYGSSVLQGTGAAHPAKTYPAILARTLNCDFVNLGFGGAGKAEVEVVYLVKQLDACCFIFDLGKSYGDQGIEPYARMLQSIRNAHPKVPIFCVTPIYSVKEVTEPGYVEKSEKLRAWMRQAAKERQNAGDNSIFVVEGLDLFGAADKELFSDPLHPGDEGNERIAERLAPSIEKVLFGKSPKP